uniref:Uncharacterized protein n=1 Tax=Magallana gigas TaxID=29159 RepID=A0A8W8I881_MAGGI|nr:putative ankyrin repeat protein RF_0381 [Crassostrea gigas]
MIRTRTFLQREKRKIQADLYEKVVRGEDDIELSFQKYRDLLNEQIIVGTTQRCDCSNVLENHPLKQKNVIEEGLKIVLGNITRGYCTCWENDVNHFYKITASISLVHAAAGFGHIKILNLLKKYSCDINAKTKNNKTPLYYAVKTRQLDIIDYLLSLGVNVNIPVYPEKFTPLHVAIDLRYMDVNHKLLTVKCLNINKRNTDGESPLLHAVRISFHEAFESLLEAGAKCDVQDEKGNTALMMGVIHGMEYVQPLINKGANLSIKNKRNQTALSFALHRLMAGDTEMVCYLVENGADPNVAGDDGNPPIVLSSIAGAFDVAQKLIKHGAEVTSKNAQGYNALHVAAWYGHIGFVNLLPRIRLDYDTRTNDGHTPLSLAAQRNQLEVINKLLPRGCNVNNMDKDGNTPLLYATLNRNLKMVSKLVNAGANPDCRNAQGQTALHIAAWNGYTDIVDLLLKTGMEHDTRTNDGNTPLSLAAHGNHLEVINMLLRLGCNVNNVDKDDDTPLLYATFNSNLKMVCKLVNAGADPDCRNHHNTTPLWNAVYKNDQDTIRYLLVKNVELEVSSRGTDQHARSNVATVIYPVPRSLLYVAALQCSVDVVMTLILAGYNIYKELIPYDIYTPMRN